MELIPILDLDNTERQIPFRLFQIPEIPVRGGQQNSCLDRKSVV